MFGFSELVSLVVSAFVILPLVIFIRECAYLIVSEIFGVENPRLTIGSGPRIYKLGVFDIRKYYHLYSWFSYDSLKWNNKFVYVAIYASPILMNVVVALTINILLVNDYIQVYTRFWDRFIFYAFYFVLFDVVPMKTVNGKPNNGMIIYEMLRYGKRVDHNSEPFFPATSEIEEEYQEEMEAIEEKKHEEREGVKEKKEQEKEEIEEKEDDKKREEQLKKEKDKEKKEEIREVKEEEDKMKYGKEEQKNQEKE